MTQIINYSEKAIAVVGDTKAIKEQLKALGGKFNKYLKCGAGWVFAASKRAEVERFIMGANTMQFTCGWMTAAGLRIETARNSYVIPLN